MFPRQVGNSAPSSSQSVHLAQREKMSQSRDDLKEICPMVERPRPDTPQLLEGSAERAYTVHSARGMFKVSFLDAN
jgi:hypothetical protein